jgi:large subunit ribosomal protein L21
MSYCIASINGSQYKLIEGEEILIDHSDAKNLDVSVFLYVDDKVVKVGKPTVNGVDIKFKEITELEKGKKVTVFKYKAKSRYRKKIGHRHQYTRLQVAKITSK